MSFRGGTSLLLLSGILSSCTIGDGRADQRKAAPEKSVTDPPVFIEKVMKWENQVSNTSETLNRVYFTDEEHGWIVGVKGTILHTTDGGHIWKRQASNTALDLTDVHFLDRMKGFVTGCGYNGVSSAHSVILYSENGGSTWEQKNIGDGTFSGADFVDVVNGWLFGSLSKPQSGGFVAEYGIIARTQDAGRSWNAQLIESGAVDKDGPIYGVSFVDPNTGWLVGSNVIRHTSDAGKTWELQYKKEYDVKSLYGFHNIRFLDNQNGWAFGYSDGDTGSYTVILRTSDGGRTWEESRVIYPIYNLLPLSSGFAIGVGAAMDTSSSGSNSIPRRRDGIIATTTDGGKKWDIIDRTGGSPLNDVVITRTGEAWCVGANGTIKHGRPQ